MIVLTKVQNVPLEVEGQYFKRMEADSVNPPEPAYFDIDSIKVNGVDITKLLDDALLNEIEEQVRSKVESGDE